MGDDKGIQFTISRRYPFNESTPPLVEGEPIPKSHWMSPEYDGFIIEEKAK
jgi:hypothetical protein